MGTVLEKVITLLPKFEIYKNNEYIGCLSKELSFFTPHYNIDYNGWHIDGTLTEWNYTIVDESYDTVAIIRKEIFNFTDTMSLMLKIQKMHWMHLCLSWLLMQKSVLETSDKIFSTQLLTVPNVCIMILAVK